ncbi:MAG: hypothetical protein Q8K83_00100 [Methylotenera sp.]|nr:hypothetical protein [Methylotenera sp.]
MIGAYGVFIITAEHYYGHTSKLGGAEVSADGLDAITYSFAINRNWANFNVTIGKICQSCRALGWWLYGYTLTFMKIWHDTNL